jgi:hypothetical protein
MLTSGFLCRRLPASRRYPWTTARSGVLTFSSTHRAAWVSSRCASHAFRCFSFPGSRRFLRKCRPRSIFGAIHLQIAPCKAFLRRFMCVELTQVTASYFRTLFAPASAACACQNSLWLPYESGRSWPPCLRFNAKRQAAFRPCASLRKFDRTTRWRKAWCGCDRQSRACSARRLS